MLTSLHLGLYAMHFVHRMEEKGDILMMIVMPLPSLIVIFIISGDIMRLLVLMQSATATNSDLLTHTLAYMEEEEKITLTVLRKLHAALSDDVAYFLFRLYCDNFLFLLLGRRLRAGARTGLSRRRPGGR